MKIHVKIFRPKFYVQEENAPEPLRTQLTVSRYPTVIEFNFGVIKYNVNIKKIYHRNNSANLYTNLTSL